MFLLPQELKDTHDVHAVRMKPEWFGAPHRRDRAYIVLNKRSTIKFITPITTEAIVAAFGLKPALSLDALYCAPEGMVKDYVKRLAETTGCALSDDELTKLAAGQNLDSPMAPVRSWQELMQHKWPCYAGHLESALQERLNMINRGELKAEAGRDLLLSLQ